MRLYKKWLTAEQVTEGLDLAGKTALITGCNSGIGFETMRVLALRGAKVIGVARTLKKANAACAKIEGDTAALECELSDPESIAAAIKQVAQPVDILIANAGVMALQSKEMVFGFEKHLFVNLIAHALLIKGLRQRLTKDASIVIVASAAHSFARGKGIDFNDLEWKREYKPWVAYGQSKLANILYTRALARRLPKGQTINCLHPGVIQSSLWRHLPKEEATRMQKNLNPITIEQGAATSVFLATNPAMKKHNGEYFSNGALGKASALAQDKSLAEKLWEVTDSLPPFKTGTPPH